MARLARFISFSCLGIVMLLARPLIATGAEELVYVDPDGVMRWTATRREVALFGVNYCLPSASDYRAAGYVGADRKKLVEQDMAHLVRMGFDGLRVCLWGDYENSDAQGNLIANDHLDVMDYLIFQARQRGVYILFTPITTYSSLWPDVKEDKSANGFSTRFQKSELGTNPEAIAAQQNYLRQMLNHVNPYTGVALKDEPGILFIEMINEPWHHSKDVEGSIKYINALVQAVRDTGCRKLTFHNLSQDFGMSKPIADSQVDGLTFAWYPSGLNANHQLRGNFLRYLDDYPPMGSPQVPKKPRLVYEFDLPDVISGYHYPAMARVYRQCGAQFAAMFSYDMLATAPYNLGWHTHLLNMVYTPQKAASAIIAGEVMRELPRGESYGVYPSNCRFGDFRVSYEQNLAEMVTAEKFMYSNDTRTTPPSVQTLRRIVGFGSSPIVSYEGVGLYFLDKLDEGRWRLEVYPDAIQVDDPFHQPDKQTIKFRLIERQWPMKIALVDLGPAFQVQPLNEGNNYSTRAADGRFVIGPGVYSLSAGEGGDKPLPEKVSGIGLREFVCPSIAKTAAMIIVAPPPEHAIGEPLRVEAQVVASQAPHHFTLETRDHSGATASHPMQPAGGYRYAAKVATAGIAAGTFHCQVSSESDGSTQTKEFDVAMVPPDADVTLFDAARDVEQLSESREGWAPNPLVAASDPNRQAVGFGYAPDAKWVPEDLTRSIYIGDRIACRGAGVAKATSVSVKIRGKSGRCVIHLVLVDKDGAASETPIKCEPQWHEVVFVLDQLKPARWALLPQAFPNGMSYWASLDGKAMMDPTKLERLQFSLRKADLGSLKAEQPGVEIESVALRFTGR